MERLGVVILPLLLSWASPAGAFETRDRVFIELAGTGIGPGIPGVGEGLALGPNLGVLVQEEEGDYVLLFRLELAYYRSVDGWGDDPRTLDLGGGSFSIGIGIPDLGVVLPYVEVGIDPVGISARSESSQGWDWGLGLHGDFGVIVALGDMITLRPAIGVCSFPFTDLDRPLGGLWFSLALGFDVEPRDYGYDDGYDDGGDDGPTSDFWIEAYPVYPSPGTSGGATVHIARADGFSDAVSVWAETPAGVQAVVMPDPASGPDWWKVLVIADPASCTAFNLTIYASSGDAEQTATVWATPTCRTAAGGVP